MSNTHIGAVIASIEPIYVSGRTSTCSRCDSYVSACSPDTISSNKFTFWYTSLAPFPATALRPATSLSSISLSSACRRALAVVESTEASESSPSEMDSLEGFFVPNGVFFAAAFLGAAYG